MTSAHVERIQYARAKEYAPGIRTKGRLTPERVGELDETQFLSWGFVGNVNIPNPGSVRLLYDEVAARTLASLAQHEYKTLNDLVQDVTDQFDASPNTVRARIDDLRSRGLVAETRDGKFVRPSLTAEGRQLLVLLKAAQAGQPKGSPPVLRAAP